MEKEQRNEIGQFWVDERKPSKEKSEGRESQNALPKRRKKREECS